MSDNIDYRKLVNALMKESGVEIGQKTGAANYGNYGHGVNGLFAFPGLEPDIYNAMVLPRLGLLDALPSRTSIYDTPLFGIMTGVTATTGSEPTGTCDDPPVAGLMKLCTDSAQWGRMSRRTPTIDLDRLGRYRDRSDFMDLRLIGDPTQMNDNVPTLGQDPALALRDAKDKIVFELSVSWARDFSKLLYSGNPTNNTSGGGYKEPYGLDILINTGRKDATSNVACPAADSIVASFQGLDVGTNGNLYVRWMTNVFQRLRFIASRTNLAPVTWAIVMPWTMFYQLSEIWPCAYVTYRCATSANFSASQPQFTDTQALVDMRDSMRGDIYTQTGQYLLMDGQRIPVLIDDGVAETASANGTSFSGSAYFVPLTVLGNTPVTYVEYFNYEGQYAAMEGASQFRLPNFWTTNNGRFLWTVPPTNNFCVQFLAKTEWRVILRTPYLAARMTNIKYTPVAQHRDWDTTDTSFYANGGGTSRVDNSYYAPS